MEIWGPFYKTDAKRQASKFDSLTGTSKRKIRRKDAMEKYLRAKGVRAKENKVAIVELCKQDDVPYKEIVETMKDGMENKRKCSKYCGKGASLTLQLNWQKHRGSTPMMVKRMPLET